jgi:hypothetical protein
MTTSIIVADYWVKEEIASDRKLAFILGKTQGIPFPTL